MNKHFRLNLQRRRMLEGYGFISFWMIGFVLFMAVPLVQSLIYSFGQLTVGAGGLEYEYIGLENYRRAFTVDVEFPLIFWDTIRKMLIQVPLILVFSMLAALLLNRQFKGRAVFRSIFFLPTIIASGPVLLKMINSGAARLPIFEQFNAMITQNMPLEYATYMTEMMNKIPFVFWESGVQVLIFLAGLQGVSISLYEAARIDGATPWETFWKVTFPIMMPIILVNTLFSIVNSFTGPDNMRYEPMANAKGMLGYMNITAFGKVGLFGYASAMGWIYFIVILILLGLVFLLFRNSASYADRR